MKKILTYGLVISSLLMPLSAGAFDWNFGAKKSAKNTRYTPVSLSSTITTLKQLEGQALAADSQVQNSFLSIVSILTSNVETDYIRSEMATILANPSLDALGKRKQVAALINHYTVNMLDNKDYITRKIAEMPDNQKAHLIGNVSLLSKGAKKYLDIAKEYSQIISVQSKVADKSSNKAVNVKQLKKNISNLKSCADSINDFASLLSGLSKSAGTGALLFKK